MNKRRRYQAKRRRRREQILRFPRLWFRQDAFQLTFAPLPPSREWLLRRDTKHV